MPSPEETIESLKEALKISADNLPLRMLLAENLTSCGRHEEAEREYTRALAQSPGDIRLAVSLAQSCFANGKYSQALVIVEDAMKKPDPPPRAFLLFARLMLNESKLQVAIDNYKRAVSLEPGLKDSHLEERLGLGASSNSSASASISASGAPEKEKQKQAVSNTSSGESLYDDHDSKDDDGDDDDKDGFSDLVEKANASFKDVGGMDEVKEQIRMKIIYPIENPEAFKAFGKKTGGGILLYGPPGCGKTHMARATAGEINARFMSIGLHQVLDMWMGNTEKNLHSIFEIARKQQPTVLFFDEVDALAASRTDMRHTTYRHVINQFLNELDGVNTSNEGVLILAATNAPWHLDSAFRRPGRFDRIVFIPPPDTKARASILRIILTGKPQEDIDFDFIAKKTDRFSGADLKALVDDCIEKKIEESMKKGGGPRPITTKDLEKSLKAVKPSTVEWFSSARNYALYSNESGLYDEIAKYLKL